MSDKVYQSKIPKYAGHTAGPWETGFYNTAIVKSGKCESALARVYWEGGRAATECEANAALIADAPYLACEVERLRELCGELVGAIENIMRLRDTDYGGATAAAWTSSFTGLRIALNKAKGGDE